MKTLLFTIFLIVVRLSLTAQESKNAVEMSPLNWEALAGAKVAFENFDGRETILLNGKVIVKDIQFSDGIIEVDIYAKRSRSFAGIVFRGNSGTMEEVYLRMHKSNQIDAIQYTPTYNEDLSWQLYREYQANVEFKEQGWNRLRIEVNGNKLSIYVNDKEVLNVDKLKTDYSEGEIGLFALFENRFSDFRYTKRNIPDVVVSHEGKLVSDPSVISQWNLSHAFPYTDKGIRIEDFSNMNYTLVNTEESGLLPISKFIKKSSSGNFDRNEEAFAIAMTTIESDIERLKVFSFDYSDKIVLYLNGEPVFSGNNAFRSKGSQFQGHLNVDSNKVYLKLKEGKNFLHCVVIERANGWGLIGKFE